MTTAGALRTLAASRASPPCSKRMFIRYVKCGALRSVDSIVLTTVGTILFRAPFRPNRRSVLTSSEQPGVAKTSGAIASNGR
jgi:hypothetical protein